MKSTVLTSVIHDRLILDFPEAKVAVREFCDVFGQPVFPTDLATEKVIALEYRLIEEEMKEYYAASTREDQLDALCDLLYVVLHASVVLSIPCYASVAALKERPKINKHHLVLNETSDFLHELKCIPLCLKHLIPSLERTCMQILQIAEAQKFQFWGGFTAVHTNNMAKLWHEDLVQEIDDSQYTLTKVASKLYLVKDVGGKVIKPPGFKKVALGEFVCLSMMKEKPHQDSSPSFRGL